MVTPLGSPRAGRPSGNQENLRRLVEARRIGKLAEEAQRMGMTEPPRVDPKNELAVQAAGSLAQKQNSTPLDNPGFWGRMGSGAMKALETVAIPGEVGASLARGLFDPSIRRRAKEIRNATPETGVVDYLKASRNAYLEKDLPMWQTLPLEIALDPLTYLPLGLISKGVKAGGKMMKMNKKMHILQPDPVTENYVKKTAVKNGDGRINHLLNRIPMPGPLTSIITKTFGKVRGVSTTLDPRNAVTRLFSEATVRTGRSESIISAVMSKLTPASAKYSIKSRKKGLDAIFDIDDKAQISGIKASFLGRTYGIKSDKPEFIGNFFEKGFAGVHGGEGLDQAAKRISKGERVWMKLNADDLRKISSYDGLTDAQLLSMRNIWALTDDVADLLEAHGTKFSRLAERLQVGKKAVQISKTARRQYFPRKVIFQGMTEGHQKAVLKKSGAAPGKLMTNLKNRKLTSEFDELLDDMIESKKLIAGNSIEGVLETYLRGAYKIINDQKLARGMMKEAKKNSGIAWSMGKTDRKIVYTNVRDVLKKGGKPKKKDIDKMREAGYERFADLLDGTDKGGAKEFLKALKGFNTFNEKQKRLKDVSRIYDRAVPGQPLPKLFDNLHFEGDKGEQLRKRFAHLLGTEEATTMSKLAEQGGKVGDVLRVGKTGFDFGFMLLQGLPMLGSATGHLLTGNIKQASKLYSAWGKAGIEGFKAFASPRGMEKFMKEMADETVDILDEAGNVIGKRSLLDEFVEMGGSLGRRATDIFAGTEILAKGRARPLVQQTLGRFEDAFTHSSDVLRLKGYQAMRTTAAKGGDDALMDLTFFLNKATGALNPTEFGIPPTQQALERAFLFFSPRYTRSSLSLIADTTRGGLSGAEARKSLLGLAGFGMGFYITMSAALGQEPELDPRTGRFMTVEIDGDRMGFGSFWTSFARAATTMTDSMFTEENIMEEQRGNPIFNYLRGRTSPITGLAIDFFNKEDFIGREFEGPVDVALHAGKAGIPFWLEAAVMGDPYRTGLAGTVGEMAGLRARPMNVWERKSDRQDELAVEQFNRLYKDLNALEKRQVVEGDVDIEVYKKLAREISSKGGGELYEQLENYYSAKEKIDEDHQKLLREGIDLVEENEFFTPAEFRELFLKEANRRRREDYQRLKERQTEGGDLSQTQEYFDTLARKYDEDMQPEDRAAKIFLNEVINNPMWDRPEGYNFVEKDKAVRDFIDEFGTDVYEYAQNYIRSGKDMMGLEAEFVNVREKYEFYWEESEKVTIQNEDYPEYAQQLRNHYISATDTERESMLNNPEYGDYLKKLNSKITATKKALRKINPGLDAFLYRWGYTTTLSHPRNEGEENFWRQSHPIDLGVYDESLSV